MKKLTDTEKLAQTEQQLLHIEDRFVRSLHFANIGSWDMNIQTGDLHWSELIAPLFGYPAGELETTYENFLAAVHDEDRQKVIDAVNACIEQGGTYDIEHRVVWPDGTIRWVLERGGVTRAQDNTALRMLGVVQDITKRKEAEKNLKTSEERFRRYFELNLIGMAITSLEKGWIYVNDRLCEITGYPENELTKLTWAEITHPDDLEADVSQFNRVLAGEIEGYIMDKRYISKDGAVVYASISVKCVRGEDGNIDHFVALVQDITERKNLEEELRQKKNFAEELIETAQTIVLLLDTEGNIVHFNRYMEEITGYHMEDLKGKSWFDVFLVSNDRGEIRSLFNKAINNAPTKGNINAIKTKHGELRDIEWHDKTLKDNEGQVIGLLAVGQDITENIKDQNALIKSEQQYRNLVEMTSDVVWEMDGDLRITYISPQIEQELGYPADSYIGEHPAHMMSVTEVEKQKTFFRQLTSDPKSFSVETCILRKDNQEISIEVNGTPFFDASGQLLGYRGINRDISERKIAEEQMRLSAMVLENTPEGIMITDDQLNIIQVNPSFVRTTGYSVEETIGKRPNMLSSGRHDVSFYENMWAALKNTGRWQGEIWNRRNCGDIYPEWLNISVIKDEQGNVTHYAGIFSDITTQEHVRDRLHNLAYYDALTKLPNRELFHDRLKNSLAQSSRQKTMVALMFLDLDRFKNINDTLGHRAGDKLLKAVAKKLQNCTREMDTVSRLGGDEFTIIIPAITGIEDAAKVAKKIIDSFSESIRLDDDTELFSATSIGISIYPDDGSNDEELIKNADTAMYRAKATGGGYQFYTAEMSAQFIERMHMESELHKALDSDGLSLVYQPQIDLETGRLIGMEALARWHHPELGWISPEKFIPIAEETGLIQQLGDWVIHKSCQQIAQWRKTIGDDWRMAINVSAKQIQGTKLQTYIRKILKETDVPGSMLELEFTESALIENLEDIQQFIEESSSDGIHLAIDDFGTGYSSLSYLKRFAIHKLKIDQSFVQDIITDKNDASIVKTIINMAQNLGLKVIAEGVETNEQLQFLIENECNEVQGYLLSQPKSSDDIGNIKEFINQNFE
jgi:diguanylate cyclase (GGDEF)-like protein/PAS domain S-box-containing protein